jgi:putative heme-binding domain-containing protein
VLIRLGDIDAAARAAWGERFDAMFPAASDFVNRELAIVMVAVGSSQAAAKLVPLLERDRQTTTADLGALLSRNRGYGGSISAMLANHPDEQQLHYALTLRNLKSGWTPPLRTAYFRWFDKARTWAGGSSYQKFLTNIDNDAFGNATDAERLAIEASGARKPYVAPELPKPHGPGRPWTTVEVLQTADGRLTGRNFKEGQRAYQAARCIVCHRFGGDGGATGPDLTQAAGRFTLKDLVDAMTDPSLVISDQYKATIVQTKEGQVHTGRIVADLEDRIVLVVNPEDATKTVTVLKTDIEEQTPSPVSLMPKELLNGLSEAELLDLVAYLLSRGDPGHPAFK